LFELNRTYKIQCLLKEEKLFFTGKILKQNNDFIYIETQRKEKIYLPLTNLLKVEEVEQ